MAARNGGPDFLYVGTSKAGSTWLFNALSIHPEAFLPSFKGLYYFDHHFDNGLDWYLAQFAGARHQKAVGEISHSYLSSPPAAARIAELNPRMRLLVCLREPVDRAFSDYLDLRKNGQYDGSFEEALDRFPRLLDRGRYAEHLERYLALFPREQIHVSLFDDLKTDAQAYADDVFAFLGIEQLQLPPASLKSRMPAGRPRNVTVARAAKSVSRWAKDAGLNSLRSRVKRSVLIRQALYRPFADERPTMDPSTRVELRRSFATEVDRLDDILGTSVSTRWGYRSVDPEKASP
ncbi:MAG TPA: sulfotransferase domain-containing protein [Nocardioidaceae bacterium]